MLNLKSKLLTALVISNIITLIVLFVYKEHGEAQKSRADDFQTLLKEEKESRFRDKEGYEHLIKQVEAVSSGKSLKDDPEWKELIKGVKASRVSAAGKTTLSGNYNIPAVFRDTVIDTMRVTCVKPYKNRFISLQGCEGDLDIQTFDSISYVVYKGRRTKKFLFFRVGQRQLESEMVNYNPYSTISYSRQVIVKKK